MTDTVRRNCKQCGTSFLWHPWQRICKECVARIDLEFKQQRNEQKSINRNRRPASESTASALGERLLQIGTEHA